MRIAHSSSFMFFTQSALSLHDDDSKSEKEERDAMKLSQNISLSLSLTRLARFSPSPSIDLPRVVVSVLQDVVRLPFIGAI